MLEIETGSLSFVMTPDLSREASFIEVEASFSTSGTDSENCLHWSQDRISFEDETTSSDEENVSLFQKVTNVINSYKSRFTEENASKAYRRSQRRKVKMLKRLFAPITSAFQLLLDILRAVITRFTNKIDKERTKVRPYSPRDQFHDNLLIAVKNKPLTPIGSVIKSNPQGNWPVCKRCVPDSADFAFQSEINCARSVYKTPKMNEHDLVKELLDKCLSDIQLSSAEESSLVPQYTHTKKIVAQLADFFHSNLDPESRELVEIQTHDTGERMLERNESGRESDVESVYTDDILGDADVPSTSSRKPSLKTKKVQKKKNKTSSEAASEDFGKSKKKTHSSQAPTVEVKPKHFPAQNSDRGKSMHFVKSEANSLRHPRTYVEDSLRSLARTAREVIPIVLLAPLTPFIDMFLSTGSLSQEGASADTKAEKEKGKFKTADVDSFGRNNSQFRAARHCRTHDKVAIYSGIPDQDTYVMTMTSSHESDSDEVEEEEFRLNLPGRRPLIVDIGASCSTFEDDQPCSFQNSRQRETDSSPDSVRSKYNNMQCGSMEDFNINKPRGEFILHTTETPSISVVAASHRSSKSEIHEDINESSSKDGYASRNKESNIGKSLSEIFTSHSSSIVSLPRDVGISYSNNILPASRDSGTLYSSNMLLLLQDVQEINSYRPLSQAKTDSYGNFSRRRSENDFQKTKKRSPEKREDGTSHYCSAPNLLSSETGFLDCDKFDGNNRSEEFDLTETALHPIKTLGVDETVFVRILSQRGRGFYDSFGKSKSVKEFCFKRKEKLPSPRDVGTMYYTNSQTENGSFRSHSDHKVYLKKTKKRQLLRETFSVEDYGARLSVPIRDVVANISSKSLAHSAASIFISRSQNTSQESIPLQVTRLDKESTVYYGARPDDETSESGVYEEMKEGAIPEEDWQPTPIDSTTGISRLEETSSEWGQKSGQKCDTFRLEKNDKPASPEASTSTSDKKSKQN